MALDRALNVVFAIMVDEHNGMVARQDVRDALAEAWEEPAPVADRDAWGATPEAIEAQNAMLRMAGVQI